MTKPMTSDEIDRALTQSHADVCAGLALEKTEKGCDRVMTTALRAAFTLGQDNGQAIILERADRLLEPNVAATQIVQLGRSMTTILAWVASKSGTNGRLFGGLGLTSGGEWQSSVMVAEAEKGDGPWSRYQYGETPAESLSKLATWCTEHDAATMGASHEQADGRVHRDTDPAPAPLEPVPATLHYLEHDQ